MKVVVLVLLAFGLWLGLDLVLIAMGLLAIHIGRRMTQLLAARAWIR